MILHLMIIDDEENVLESLVPGLVNDLARRLRKSPELAAVNSSAGFPLPASDRINIKVSAVGYASTKVSKYAHHQPVHLHLHLCCEKGGSFRHALRLLKEQFFAVVVSDLRFSDDTLGSRAGRFFIEDMLRRNPETFGILYSAYQKPDKFPTERFVRKGSAANLGGEELLEKMIEGCVAYLGSPNIQRLARELGRRGLVYQSERFGATLRRLYDYAKLYFDPDLPNEQGRRRPRPTLLLDGETGTGKTELAGLIHQISARRDQPFVSATCNQLGNENFLRSILFGHIKGSFSGAMNDRPGLVESAGAGVLLLDDLHKLDDGCSLILHSFLDDGEYSHLGEDEVRRSSQVAIVCTAETPLWEEIKTNNLLAESFLYRVEQLVLRIPPLRDRPEDIEYQANFFCTEQSKRIGEEMELSPEAIEWLVDFGFPGGNSRKLRDFLGGVITTHASVTDCLDVGELQEYATQIGLLGKSRSVTVARSGGASAPTAEGSEEDWASVINREGWQSRVVRLAACALAEERKLDPQEAQTVCQALFEERFPKLWEEFLQVTRSPGADRPIEIKLFDEIFRYYAVFRAGNPAKAAKELGMKDNALREFIYSREQKRIKQ